MATMRVHRLTAGSSQGIAATWLCQKLPLESGVLCSGGMLTPACTVIAKATFPLLDEPGSAAVESVFSGDVSRDCEGRPEPHYPSDFVPYKPSGEFLVLGTAVRPADAARERFQARVQVGPISKAIEVVGNRTWTRSFCSALNLCKTVPTELEKLLVSCASDDLAGALCATGELKSGEIKRKFAPFCLLPAAIGLENVEGTEVCCETPS